MAEYLIQGETLTGIADKIRPLLGLTGTMTPEQMQTHLTTEQANITAALAALVEKGVTVPDGSNSDALAGLIAAIEAGGGSGGLFYETKKIGDLSLLDVIQFGNFEGNSLFWFVADTDYEGHVIFANLSFGVIPEFEFTKGDADYETTKYRTSSIRQFLNATESQGWYSQQVEGVGEPSYAKLPGFLSGFSSEELLKIVPFDCKCIEYSSENSYEIITVTDKVWIPSRKQVGGNAGTAEGSRAFNSNSLIRVIGPFKVDCPSIFKKTRTQSSSGHLIGRSDSGIDIYLPSTATQWPFCISLDKQANVRKASAGSPLPVWEFA